MTKRKKVLLSAIVMSLLVMWFAVPALIWGQEGFYGAAFVFGAALVAVLWFNMIYHVMWG